MKRRQFIKDVAAVAGTATLLPATGSLVSGCSTPAVSDSWDFDEVLDRTGTWSIKYGRAADGQIPMWIADMDFRTAPAVSSALRERLKKDVMGYTSTPEELFDTIVGWEERMHGWRVEREWVEYCPGVITSINQAYL